jgi:glycosyltransferase involved in cell wall biosynthesis
LTQNIVANLPTSINEPTMREKMKQVSSPSRPLRIGLVTPAWPGSRIANGIATAVAHLTAGLEACGHEVTILPFVLDAPHEFPRIVNIPEQRWSLPDKLLMRFGPDPDGVLHRKVGQRIAAAVQEAISRHGIEILVMEESHGWAGVVCRHVPIPVVATLHGPWCLHKAIQNFGKTKSDVRREARESRALQQVQGITAPSRDALQRTAALWSLPDVPRAVIHNPMPVRPLIGSGDPERMLFVGRFDFVKGGDLVLEAFAEVARRHPTCSLTFVGPDRGVDRPGLARLFMQEALMRLPEATRARIDVQGQCSADYVSALRQTHGLTIVASRYEVFAGTMLEAMAAGSALVCTSIGGCAELLLHEQTAMLVPPEDPQALAQACLQLLDNPELGRRMGAAARAHVERHLSPEIIGQQMAEYLVPLCRGRAT